jgi:putative membrane protein
MNRTAIPSNRHHSGDFHGQPPSASTTEFDAREITRPDPVLAYYYVIVSLLTTVAFPFVLVPLLCKYYTLRYRFDDSGVAVRWGVFFRREIYLNYRRIQDIHLTRNLIQRWMGLATISIQTASGNASPEINIEGVLQAEPLRDYLYAQMRGAKEEAQRVGDASDAGTSPGRSAGDEALELLREIRDELRRVAGRRERS